MESAPINSRNLSAFALDIHYYLEQTGLFSKIKTKKTGQANCALIVIGRIANASTTQEEVAQTLERIWHEAPLGYGHQHDSYKITLLTGEVQMQFATRTDLATVTGRIEISGFA